MNNGGGISGCFLMSGAYTEGLKPCEMLFESFPQKGILWVG